jgi:hypothetical protein
VPVKEEEEEELNFFHLYTNININTIHIIRDNLQLNKRSGCQSSVRVTINSKWRYQHRCTKDERGPLKRIRPEMVYTFLPLLVMTTGNCYCIMETIGKYKNCSRCVFCTFSLCWPRRRHESLLQDIAGALIRIRLT